MRKKIQYLIVQWIGKALQIGLVLSLCSVTVAGQSNGEKEIATLKKMGVLSADTKIIQDISKSAVLNKIISVHVKNLPLIQALNGIADKANLEIIYNSTFLSTIDRKIRLELNQVTVEKALWATLEDTGLRFAVSGNKQLILFKKIDRKQSQPLAEVVSGTVTDGQTGETLPGVNILVKGTSTGASTDGDGNFELTVENLQDTLVVSFVGYQTQEIPINGRTEIDVALQTQAISGEEMVVVGYGTQQKQSLTSSISSIEGEEITAVPVADLSNTIGGRMPGVIVKQGSGEPGRDESQIFIRGVSTTGSTSPLFIVDGIPRDFRELDPNSIESFTVLKDAAAVAPYGVAGANGVVLVTTKKGKSGEPTLSYRGSVGFQNPTVLPNYANGFQYAKLRNLAAKNEGLQPVYTDEELQIFKNESNTDVYPNNDPFEYFVNNNSPLTKHSIQLSGGSEDITYYISAGYQFQGGMWETTNNERYNLSANFEAQATKTTKISLGINGRFQERRYIPSDRDNETGRIFELMQYVHPGTGPLRYSNGMPGTYVTDQIYGDGYHNIGETTLFTQLSFEQEIPFISGLSFSGTLAYDPTFQNDATWRAVIHDASIDTTQTPPVIQDGIFGQNKPSLLESKTYSQQLTYQAQFNYTHSFGKSSINALALFEAKTNERQVLEAGRQNYDLTIDEIDLGSSANIDMSTGGYSTDARQLGLVYRMTYDYDSRYLFEASGRYDGSYYFAPGNRYGFFPAFSIGWRLSEENFVKNNFEWLENLKLKGSYGEVGALAGSPFQYLSTYNVVSPVYAFNNNAVQGVVSNTEANPYITWERAEKTNIGLEASILEGFLNFEIDYFHEKRSNMLVSPNVVVPLEYGIGLSQENAGIMNNQGIEFSILSNYQLSKDAQISLGFNYTYAKNELEQVFETDATYNNPNRRRTGRALGTQFGYNALGYFQPDDFDNSGNLKPGIATPPAGAVNPGDIRYEDINEDGVINSEDHTVIGDPVGAPGVLYGIPIAIQFKGFSLDALFQGTAQSAWYKGIMSAFPFWRNLNGYADNLDSWSPDNPNAKYPRLSSSPTGNNTQISSFWVEDASYLRLKTITLGYIFPLSLLSRTNIIKNFKMYLSAQNILTFSTDMMEHFDPEIGRNTSYRPNSSWTYPQQKVVSLGINITF